MGSASTGSIGQRIAPFIDGTIRDPAGTREVEVVDPSNGRRLFMLPAGNDEDVEHAVGSARRAFDDGRWSDAPPSFRARTLERFAALIADHAATLDALDAEEMGKPVSQPRANAAGAAALMKFHAESVDKITGDVYGSDRGSFVVQRRVPRGVVAAVTPWNFPTYNAVLKIAPALAAGNCVVLKPSELASRSSLHLAGLAMEAGLPAGVLNVTVGLGKTVGRALGLHPDVDMLTFTGSTATGKQMLRYASESNMKVVMAECGGKSPQIVFDDGVSLDDAANFIAALLLTNSGQLCTAGSRLLVQKSIEGKLVEKVTAQFRRIVMGNALDPRTTFGPLASAQQCARVMQYIDSASNDGATLLCGGRRALPDTGGFFVEPTLFHVDARSRMAQEEIFGPVLSVVPFGDEAEAVRLANDSVYGLAAYAWTTDLSRAMRLAKSIRSTVLINAAAPAGEGPGHAASAEPFRQSGIGVEGGLAGIESYLRRQLVWINHA